MTSVGVTGPFSEGNNCGTSPLAAALSCTVTVAFAPTAAGFASGTLSVNSSAVGSPLTVALSGTGTAAANTNLALNQPATSSGYTQTYAPGNAVDGDTNSYWESTDNAFPQWFQVDLGAAHSVGRIVMDLPPSSLVGHQDPDDHHPGQHRRLELHHPGRFGQLHLQPLDLVTPSRSPSPRQASAT